VAPVLFTKDSVRAWSDSVRRAVIEAVTQATAELRRMAEEDDVVCTQALNAKGCELIALSDSERIAFVTATRAAITAMRANFDAPMLALFEHDLARASR
jgi:TRAP-type C4-dicarboxylate transport system substrate-binding protein